MRACWAFAGRRVVPAPSAGVKATTPTTICHRTSIRADSRPSNTAINMRKSFSRLKKKLKHSGGKRTPDSTGADDGEERIDPEGLLLRPVPHVVTGSGCDREEDGANTDGRHTCSADRPSPPGVPELVPAGGSGCDQGERGGGVGVMVGSGPGQEETTATERLIPPVPHSGKPLPPLPLDNMGTPATLDHLGVPHPDEHAEPSAVVDEIEPNWDSTASATATLLLCGVRDSINTFGPLRSVAGCLCFILENCKVSPPCTPNPQCLQ